MTSISLTSLIQLPRAIATTKLRIFTRAALLTRIRRIRDNSIVVSQLIVTPALCDPS